MHDWQVNKKAHLCAACIIRAMPETEIPPRYAGGGYLFIPYRFKFVPFFSGFLQKILAYCGNLALEKGLFYEWVDILPET